MKNPRIERKLKFLGNPKKKQKKLFFFKINFYFLFYFNYLFLFCFVLIPIILIIQIFMSKTLEYFLKFENSQRKIVKVKEKRFIRSK
jgi:hypothetical protein